MIRRWHRERKRDSIYTYRPILRQIYLKSTLFRATYGMALITLNELMWLLAPTVLRHLTPQGSQFISYILPNNSPLTLLVTITLLSFFTSSTFHNTFNLFFFFFFK